MAAIPKIFVLPPPGQQIPNQITQIRQYMKFHIRYTAVSCIHSHMTITNLDKWVEVSMTNPNTPPPRKFTTLSHEYMDLCTPEGATQGLSIDCLYLADNPMAKDLSTKIMVCPSTWWWHLFKCRGYTEHTIKSLMDSFDYEALLVADQSTFNKKTWSVNTQFANSDDFLDCFDAELGFENDDDPSLDESLGGSPHQKTSFKITADAKASLASALTDPDMDLAANSHASAKSWCTNFSLSTGDSTNRSVNTKQFTITHKSRALALAMETKWAAQLEFKNKEMARHLQELKAMLATGNTATIPTLAPPASSTHRTTRIAGAEFAKSAVETLKSSTSDGNSSESDVQIILPHAAQKIPAKPVLRVPSKTRLPAHKDGAGARYALVGDY